MYLKVSVPKQEVEEAHRIHSYRRMLDYDYYNRAIELSEFMDPIEKEKKVRKTAFTSRIIILLLQILSTSLIPRHENDGFRTPKDNLGSNGTFLDSFVNSTLSGFVNWDGEYFLHVTTNGYTHENTIAFFPLFPSIIGITSHLFHLILFPILSFQSITQLLSWTLNTWCFIESAVVLAKIVKYCDRGLYNLDTIVVFLFCYNPASIFFSSFYSESLFAYTTFNLLLSLYDGNLNKSIIFASLSAITRSNGLLNFGFIGAFLLRDILIIHKQKCFYLYQKIAVGSKLCWKLLYCSLGLIPFCIFQMYCAWKFCGRDPNEAIGDALKLCNLEELPYMHIQSKNWNVGFLRYFELLQLPNFLLASPALVVLGYESYKRVAYYGKCITKQYNYACFPDLALGLHGLFLTFFCLFFIHVQVSTRMIMSSCPYLYIFIAKSLRTDLCRIRAREISWLQYSSCIHTWFSTYFILGALLFSRGYPWT